MELTMSVRHSIKGGCLSGQQLYPGVTMRGGDETETHGVNGITSGESAD